MSQYKDGTASVNNNSNIVTGSGTLWLANISAGDLFTKVGDDVAYTVAGVTNNTILTLTAPYSGSTSNGSTYGITIGFTAGGLPLLSAGDLNTAAIYNEAMKGIDNQNQSLGTAAYADLTSSSATIWDGGNLNYTAFPSSKGATRVVGIFYAMTVAAGYVTLNTHFKGTRAANISVTSTFKLSPVADINSITASGISGPNINLSGSRSDVITMLYMDGMSGLTDGQAYYFLTETNTSEILLS